MEPRIVKLSEKKLIGRHITMSFSENRTRALWRSFMPRRDEIKHKVGTDLYSAEVYDPLFFKNFDPAKEFEKWAAVEVKEFDTVPNGMDKIIFPSGLYAIFLHKGSAVAAQKTYQYIFNTWIPSSDFIIDNRPHFAVMGEKYKPKSPNSEEEVWIPIEEK